MSAGRIKIGRLGPSSLYVYPPASCDTFGFEVFALSPFFIILAQGLSWSFS